MAGMESANELDGPLTAAERQVIAQAGHLVEANFSRGSAPLTLDLSDDRPAVRDEIVRQLHSAKWLCDVRGPVVVVTGYEPKVSS